MNKYRISIDRVNNGYVFNLYYSITASWLEIHEAVIGRTTWMVEKYGYSEPRSGIGWVWANAVDYMLTGAEMNWLRGNGLALEIFGASKYDAVCAIIEDYHDDLIKAANTFIKTSKLNPAEQIEFECMESDITRKIKAGLWRYARAEIARYTRDSTNGLYR